MSLRTAGARWAKVIRRRLRLLLRNRELRREIEEELRGHVEMEAEALRRRGVDEREARRAAVAAFGGIERTLEQAHEAYGGRGLHDRVREHALAARTLLRRPVTTFAAVTTLALGLGSVTAFFTLVDGVILSALPFREADRLDLVGMRRPGAPAESLEPISPLDFGDVLDEARAYAEIAAFGPGRLVLRAPGAEPVEVAHALATANLFSTLGQLPAVGRLFGPEDGRPGAPAVVVLSHELWHSRLGGDTAVVGRTVRLGDDAATVVGVTEPGMVMPRSTEVWSNYRYGFEIGARQARWLQAVGRRAPGVSPEAARAELLTIASRLESEHPSSNSGWTLVARPLRDAVVGPVSPALVFLLGATGLILLLALSNVAGLVVTQSEVRAREFALRGALGAGRRDVLRQLLAEGVVLTASATVVGLGVAVSLVAGLQQLAPPTIPRLDEVRVGWHGVAFLIGAALPIALALSALPARRLLAVRGAVGGAYAVSGVRGARLSRWLVGFQVALSTVLLVGAALLGRSFVHLIAEDGGYDPGDVVALRVDLPAARYPTPESVADFFAAFAEIAGGTAGVTAASVASALPLGERVDRLLEYSVLDRASAADASPPTAYHRQVGPDFFATLGVEIVAGRALTDADRAGAPGVAVVNERLVSEAFPEGSPLGQRLAVTAGNFGGRSAILVGEVEIVGVSRDVRYDSPRTRAEPTIYLAHRQAPFAEMYVLARLARPLDVVLPSLRQRLRALDAELFVGEVVELPELRAAATLGDRFLVVVLGGFASVALLLSIVGVFGVVASSVARRTSEMAVRQALGADGTRVLRMVVGEMLGLIAAGAALGIAAALALSGVLERLLYGISPTDPGTLAGVAAIVVGVGLAVALGAGLKVLRLPPAEALRRA